MAFSDLLRDWFGRRGPTKARSGTERRQWISNPWHAVSIAPGPHACEAVQRLARERFLSAEAPPLPVDGCTAHNCLCGYRHFPDRRRSEPRRHADVFDMHRPWNGIERRQSRGRRASD